MGLASERVPCSDNCLSDDLCPDDVLLQLDLVLRLHHGAVGQLRMVRQLEHLLSGHCHRPQHGQLHLVGLAEQ